MTIAKNIFTPKCSYIVLSSLLGLAILITSTGLYEAELMPKDEILVSVICIILLLASYTYSKNFGFIDAKILLGFGLFNGFFIIRLLFPPAQEVEVKLFFVHMISLGSFVAIYSAGTQLLSNKTYSPNINPETLLALLATLALTILLLAQLAQIHGESSALITRPGGFLNPNTAAAIALLLAYTTSKLSQLRSCKITKLTSISLIFTVCIIMLSQSRSVLLALVPFLLYILSKHLQLKNLIITAAILITIISVGFAISPELRELLFSYLGRFRVDEGSEYRFSLLQSGWTAFTEAPVWGNGYRYITSFSNHSTHNEIIEILANFGLAGLLIIGLACYFLYIPFSLMFCISCILPVFLFTHNFFDSYGFQATLGMALAAEKYSFINTNKQVKKQL